VEDTKFTINPSLTNIIPTADGHQAIITYISDVDPYDVSTEPKNAVSCARPVAILNHLAHKQPVSNNTVYYVLLCMKRLEIGTIELTDKRFMGQEKELIRALYDTYSKHCPETFTLFAVGKLTMRRIDGELSLFMGDTLISRHGANGGYTCELELHPHGANRMVFDKFMESDASKVQYTS
jgi:hypothetical protein